MEYYSKYLKYKKKYLELKGGTRLGLENQRKITEYLPKDVCFQENLKLINLLVLRGETQATSGSALFTGLIKDVMVAAKIIAILEELPEHDKLINEVGLTHFISDYFSDNKLTDNIVQYYYHTRCNDFLKMQDGYINKILFNLFTKWGINRY
jgi:hypothetical protein